MLHLYQFWFKDIFFTKSLSKQDISGSPVAAEIPYGLERSFSK